jgi:hypothetical protein
MAVVYILVMFWSSGSGISKVRRNLCLHLSMHTLWRTGLWPETTMCLPWLKSTGEVNWALSNTASLFHALLNVCSISFLASCPWLIPTRLFCLQVLRKEPEPNKFHWYWCWLFLRFWFVSAICPWLDQRRVKFDAFYSLTSDVCLRLSGILLASSQFSS